MASAHDRILAISVTADESDDTLTCSAVNYYRDRNKYNGSDGFSVGYSGGTAAANCDIALGQVIPPPTHVILVSTFQA